MYSNDIDSLFDNSDDNEVFLLQQKERRVDPVGMKSTTTDINKDDLVQILKDYKNQNLALLEDNRRLLLNLEDAHKIEMELEERKNELIVLRKHVQTLEGKTNENVDGVVATSKINELSRQISQTSSTSFDESKIFYMKDRMNARKSSMDAIISGSQDLILSNPVSGGYEYLQKVGDEGSLITQQQFESPFVESDSPICICGTAQKLSEVIKVNHFWQKDYTSLMDDHNQLKARLWATESQLKNIERENLLLHEKLEQERENTHQQTSVETIVGLTEPQTFTTDDVEALKQQLLIYKEDFEQEKEDNRKLTADHNQMKLELQKAYSIIDKLTLKNNTIKENYKRVSTEKEHIIRELRKLSTSSNALPFSPVNPDYRLPRTGSEETLNSEDVIAHSACKAKRATPRVFYGGHVERDGLTLTLEKHKRDQYNQ